MNQKLSDWASIAEIVSGIAIVVTLVFLLLGLRENTEVTRAATYERSVESLNQWRFEMARNPELSRVFIAGSEDRLETWRQGLMLVALFGIYDKIYHSYQYGTLGLTEWNRIEAEICRNRGFWEDERWEEIEVFLSAEFVSHVELVCEDRAVGPARSADG